MTVYEEWFEQPGDEPLRREHLADFQRRVAWPAINNLCQVDFVEEAVPPDDMIHIRKVIGGYYYQFEIGFWRPGYDDDDEDYDEDPDDEPYIYADLTVSRRRDDLREQLITAFKLDRTAQSGHDRSEPRPDPDEASLVIADGEVAQEEYDAWSAWETRRYHFRPESDEGIGVDIVYELADGSLEDIVWTTDNPVSWPSREWVEEEEEADETFSESLGKNDLSLIRKGFAALGVHPAFLDWQPPKPEELR